MKIKLNITHLLNKLYKVKESFTLISTNLVYDK